MDERNDGGIRCSEVLERLSDYVDGDLDAATVAKIEVHLRACDNCERFGRDFGAMVVSTRSLDDDESVEESVLDAIRVALDTA
ncbi:MAG: zf-HC2 domain-containing protein [Myxococcota bacterium]